ESRRWWAAAHEAATEGWPPPVRSSVPVNVTVPAVDAERAHAIVVASGCRTAKVKVAEPGQSPADELDRVGLEYVEQPCATLAELVALRRRIDVRIAADEVVRRSADPLRVDLRNG